MYIRSRDVADNDDGVIVLHGLLVFIIDYILFCTLKYRSIII